MTAAVITATSVAKIDAPISQVSGSNRRMKTLYLEGAKAAQNDWFLLTTYLTTAESAQIAGWRAVTEASGNAHAIDVITYDSDDAKLDLTSTDTGVSKVFVDYYEA